MTEDHLTLRENLIAEILSSMITGLSLMSCLMMVRGFSEYMTISGYWQLFPVILVAIHVLIRRKWPGLLQGFLMTNLSSAVFFSVFAFVPFSEFARNGSNIFYLGLIVLMLTFYSVTSRMSPKKHSEDSQIIAFPACIFPIFGLFYILMRRPSLVEDLMRHTFLIVVFYIVMRQISSFEKRYHYSIRSSSDSMKRLKKQNYKTAAALVGIFILSFAILKIIPVGTLTELVITALVALARIVIPIIVAIIDLFGKLFRDMESDGGTGEGAELPYANGPSGDEIWLKVLAGIIAVLFLIGLVMLIINSIRVMIQNAPRFGKTKETTSNGVVVDTIELLRPETVHSAKIKRDFGKGYERHVRKQFYDKTARAMKKGLPVFASSTPGQIEKTLRENGDKDISALRQEYEKVRYGR